jgi:hypothetical protein
VAVAVAVAVSIDDVTTAHGTSGHRAAFDDREGSACLTPPPGDNAHLGLVLDGYCHDDGRLLQFGLLTTVI